MLSLSGSKAQVFLQIFLSLLTWYVVNVTAELDGFYAIATNRVSISLYTNRVVREEVCMPSFEVVNRWLK